MCRATIPNPLLPVVILAFASTPGLYAQSTLYVDETAPPEGDGLTWESAYNDLQDAFVDAFLSGGTVTEIWVAQGVYKPDRQTGDREATFLLLMVNGVATYGGFEGGEIERHQRNPTLNETILSGDIGIENQNDDNSYHVLNGSQADNTAVLDGFTITNGNDNRFSPDGNGGAVFNDNGSPTLVGCKFVANAVRVYGGAIYNAAGSSPALIGCLFRENSAQSGAGVYNTANSNPELIDCVFTGNSASSSGAGMYNDDGTSPTLTNCEFLVNSGHGVYNFSSDPNLIACVFFANSKSGIYNRYSEPTLVNCAFVGNTASGIGGGVNNSYGNLTAANCVFIGNAASSGGGMYNSGGSPVLINCTFRENWANGNGGGIGGYGGTLVNCILWGNKDSGGTDESAQLPGNSVVTYSCIQGLDGFAGDGNIGDNPLFRDEPAGLWTGDGVYDPGTYQTTFTDANASWDDAEFVGRILNPDATQYVQSVIVANTETTITVWGDFASLGEAWDIYEINDFHLQAPSPAINAGDPDFDPENVETDIDGDPRIMAHRVDMGADEFRIGDGDQDGDLDLDDYREFQDCYTGPFGIALPDCLVFDFDRDGNVDVIDFAIFQDGFTGPG